MSAALARGRLRRIRDARVIEMRGISRCWQWGYHVYGAGPCFDTPEQAQGYRDAYDKAGNNSVAHRILNRRYGIGIAA